jgi:hypothetical protein
MGSPTRAYSLPLKSIPPTGPAMSSSKSALGGRKAVSREVGLDSLDSFD